MMKYLYSYVSEKLVEKVDVNIWLMHNKYAT